MNKQGVFIYRNYYKKVSVLLFLLFCYIGYAQSLSSKDSSEFLEGIEQVNPFNEQHNKLQQAKAIFDDNPQQALTLVEDVLIFAIDKQGALLKGKQDVKSINTLKGKAYELLGDFNLSNQIYNQALDNYLKAEDAYKRKGKSFMSYKLVKNIALTYKFNKKYKKSLEYYLHVELIAKSKNVYTDVISAKNEIGELYYILGQVHLAESYHLDALDLALKYQDEQGVRMSTLALEELNLKLKENDNISEFDKKMKSISNSFGHKDLEEREYQITEEKIKRFGIENRSVLHDSLVNTHIGNLRVGHYGVTENVNSQNEVNRAIIDLKEEIFVASNEKTYPELSEALYKLYTLYEENGKHDLALESLKAYYSIQDSIVVSPSPEVTDDFDEELKTVQQKLSFLERRKDLDLKTIEVLKQQQTLDKEAIKNVKERSIFLTGGLILLGIIVILFIRLNQSRKRANELLRLKGLQAQMNPHFIFNTLNSVNNFISKNDERSANRYISDFSKLMRQVLELAQEDLITLEQEVEMISLYLKLEHLRFKDKFDYTIDIDDSLDVQEILLPPMLVQPFIENAIWHGLRYKEKDGHLNIRVSNHKSFCMISVEDNGIGRAKSSELKTKNQKNHKSTALKNIESRLSYIKRIFKKRLEVEIIDKAEGTGTIVLIKLFK